MDGLSPNLRLCTRLALPAYCVSLMHCAPELLLQYFPDAPQRPSNTSTTVPPSDNLQSLVVNGVPPGLDGPTFVFLPTFVPVSTFFDVENACCGTATKQSAKTTCKTFTKLNIVRFIPFPPLKVQNYLGKNPARTIIFRMSKYRCFCRVWLGSLFGALCNANFVYNAVLIRSGTNPT